MKSRNLDELQKRLDYRFNSPKLLVQALTHSSWINETNKNQEHNERLEFLGDAVLELCISDLLYVKFTSYREGELTRIRSNLVNATFLAKLAKKIGIVDCLLLGRGEEQQGGRLRENLLADAFEAIIGAVYIDSDFAQTSKVIKKIFNYHIADSLIQEKEKDFKTRLQEEVQRKFKKLPAYSLVSNSGPEHAKTFTVRLDLPDETSYLASGSSVKRAEHEAAKLALEKFK